MKIEKAPAGADHEIKDLEVYEVSLVDRPANKRRFLTVKSEAELVEDKDGYLHKVEPKKDSTKAEPTEDLDTKEPVEAATGKEPPADDAAGSSPEVSIDPNKLREVLHSLETQPQNDAPTQVQQESMDRLAKLEKSLGVVTQAQVALMGIFKKGISTGPRPDSQQTVVGETVEKSVGPAPTIWPSDMNSGPVPDDEQF